MKDDMVGSGTGTLLWPDGDSAKQAKDAELLSPVLEHDSDLLWPAALINQQARASKQRSYALPFAIATFACGMILGVIAGILPLIMIATTGNYTWVTTVFYNSMLRVIFPCAGVVALMALVSLILLWIQPILKQRTVLALAAGSLIEIALIWIFGELYVLTPPQLMLVLIGGVIILFIAVLIINKQYVATPTLSLVTKALIIILAIIACIEAVAGVAHLMTDENSSDSSEVQHLATLQAEARVEEVSEQLSDLVFTLCGGKYQVVQLSDFTTAGLFECSESGGVYSVVEDDTTTSKIITGGATYLGTTKDDTISLAFPNTYYLYRSLPQVLSEDELALMFPATSEQELVDNLAPILLNYWQEHNEHNLYLNVFYNPDISQINATRDYILMSALGTMVMAEGLPRGLTLRGVANGAMTDYVYHLDTGLAALNELGGMPDAYAYSTREALMTNRHISLHLVANEVPDYDTLVEWLWESFTGGV